MGKLSLSQQEFCQSYFLSCLICKGKSNQIITYCFSCNKAKQKRKTKQKH